MCSGADSTIFLKFGYLRHSFLDCEVLTRAAIFNTVNEKLLLIQVSGDKHRSAYNSSSSVVSVTRI